MKTHRIYLFVFMLVLGAITACATLRNVGYAAIDCGKPALAGAIASVSERVEKLLNDGEPDWKAALDELKMKAFEAVVCVVARVASADRPMTFAAAVEGPADRAAAYLREINVPVINVR